MKAYSVADEEALLAREKLKDWAGEGFVTEAQRQRIEQETVCELRRTNVFLRLVLFFFTLLIVAAVVGLFLLVLGQAPQSGAGVMLLVLAVAAYFAAEFAVSQARLYRYGIEEGLLVCSTGLVGTGVYFVFSNGSFLFASGGSTAELLAPAAACILSVWIWYRFGLFYFCLGAMVFAAWLTWQVSSLPAVRHLTLAALYGASLLAVAVTRPRYRFTYLERQYSIAEALLWCGIYFSLNLQLGSVALSGFFRAAPVVSQTFYWTTWVLIWCLPPVVLARGIRRKDRWVIAAGLVLAILTLVTNKPYVGGERHTWDPMVLGALLMAVALMTRRWLAQGPNEIRHGLTARRLSGEDKTWLETATTAFSLVAQPATPGAADRADARLGGGEFGGGGASSDW